MLKFVDEEAPAAIQPKTLYIPKPEIQVILAVLVVWYYITL